MVDLSKRIDEVLGIKLGLNKSNELSRLVYEICKRNGCSWDEILNQLKIKIQQERVDKGGLFLYSKKYLLTKRFPQLSSKRENFVPYLNKLDIVTKERLDYPKDLLPEKVFITQDVKNHKFTEEILERLPSKIEIEEISSLKEYRKSIEFNPYKLRKRDLFVTGEKQDFFKPCPCTKFHVGCGYYIMNLAFGCPMDCSYCYLQQYSNFPGIIININLEDYFLEFDKLYKSKGKRMFRIGTGEFADSLAFDRYTHYSRKLINFFKDKEVLLELKTKTDDVGQLLGLQHNKKIVISWSLNPEDVIKNEELYTISLNKRLSSAKKCQHAGYRIGFHFDPIIYYAGWEEDYKKVVDELFNTINPPICWISLGTLRFNPKLKPIIEHRFPESNIIYGELVVAEDGKLRYPKFLRKRIYHNMIKWIREYDKEVGIYLCMESSDIWKEVIMPVETEVENYVIYQALRC